MTTTYKIHVFYCTGDSNGSHDEDFLLEMSWKDLSKAKAALKRIQEHYVWFAHRNGWDRAKRDLAAEPEWHKGMSYEFQLKVELDNGVEVEFGAPWCGYFETLYSAKIVVESPQDPDLEITFQ